MTIQELYDWAVANNCADAKLTVTNHISRFKEVDYACYFGPDSNFILNGLEVKVANTVCLD